MTHIWKSKIPLFLAASLITNMLVYHGTRLFMQGFVHYDMTTEVDRNIPFLPWTITIYLGCYVFWIINYGLGCLQEEECAEHFLCADFFAKLICGLCFVFLPTTNIRPEISGTGLFDNAISWLYHTDAADNLFPSIHCLTSWFCVIAVRRQQTISRCYKILSVLFALAVCASTLTTKQHVIADVIAGIFLAELSFRFVEKSGFLTWYKKQLMRGSKI